MDVHSRFCVVPQIQVQLKPYADALIQGMPQKLKLPFYQYGSRGNVVWVWSQLLHYGCHAI